MGNNKCNLSDEELIIKANDWVSKLSRSAGQAWVLRVPVDFNHDPDMLFIELSIRLAARNDEIKGLKSILSGDIFKGTMLE